MIGFAVRLARVCALCLLVISLGACPDETEEAAAADSADGVGAPGDVAGPDGQGGSDVTGGDSQGGDVGEGPDVGVDDAGGDTASGDAGLADAGTQDVGEPDTGGDDVAVTDAGGEDIGGEDIGGEDAGGEDGDAAEPLDTQGAVGAACCTSDSDCEAPAACVPVPGEAEGACKEAAAGGCWADGDCPEGVACQGVSVCSCEAQCGVPDSPGKCQGGPVGCCEKDQDCAEGERCVGLAVEGVGVCKPIPSFGQCWDGDDCSPSQTCDGGTVCPCNADCDVPDTVGVCTGGDMGCCTVAGVCPEGQQCLPLSGVGWSTCVDTPEPGRCWSDGDCPDGHSCEGAAMCPCNADCDMEYEGPGVCAPPGDACTPISEGWVTEVCDAASVAIFDGDKCVQTCPGCCGCMPFCDMTFMTIEECEAACLPDAGCALWDGSCDDAIPESPWWALTATGCEEITTCVCEGCIGTFATEEACAACL